MKFIMRCARGLYMSLGMFSIIPLPFQLRNDSGKHLILPFFPLIGGIVGFLWWGAATLIAMSGMHVALVAAVLALFPFFITGFLHLDGYMDTSDAILSRRAPEDKLRILKDPHTGAFAVIMLAMLFILQFAASYAIIDGGKPLAALATMPVISRCCAALAVLCLKTMPQSGYGNMFKQNVGTPHKIFILLTSAAAIALSYPLAGVSGLAVSAAALAGSMAATAYAYKDLNGISGDLAGFALVIGELCGLIALAIV